MAMNLPQPRMMAFPNLYPEPVRHLVDVVAYFNCGDVQDFEDVLLEFGWKPALFRGVVLDKRAQSDGLIWFCLRISEIHIAGTSEGLAFAAPLDAHISIGKYYPQANLPEMIKRIKELLANLDIEVLMRQNDAVSSLTRGLVIFEFHIRSKGQKTFVAIEQKLSAGGIVSGRHRSPTAATGYGPGFHLSVRSTPLPAGEPR